MGVVNLLRLIKSEFRLRVSDELLIYVVKSLRDLLLLVVEFFIENTMIQVISSFKHNRVPLRDLFHELIDLLNIQSLIYFTVDLSVETIALIWILFCFSHGEVGLRVIQKGARCLIIARSIRICVFTMTILPSAKPWCQFNGPIEPFTVRVGGACNDLLYSGHVTIYTLTGISFSILSQRYSVAFLRYVLPLLVWFHIIQRIMAAILEGHHYSIDMFVGFIVTSLIWNCSSIHIDLPQVPRNLSLHLRRLISPHVRSILKEV